MKTVHEILTAKARPVLSTRKTATVEDQIGWKSLSGADFRRHVLVLGVVCLIYIALAAGEIP